LLEKCVFVGFLACELANLQTCQLANQTFPFSEKYPIYQAISILTNYRLRRHRVRPAQQYDGPLRLALAGKERDTGAGQRVRQVDQFQRVGVGDQDEVELVGGAQRLGAEEKGDALALEELALGCGREKGQVDEHVR
jgi:hypothetical protein